MIKARVSLDSVYLCMEINTPFLRELVKLWQNVFHFTPVSSFLRPVSVSPQCQIGK